MSVTMRNAFSKAVLSLVFSLFVLSIASYAQNQVLGEVQFVSKTKLENLGGVDRRTICRLRRRAQGRQESFTSARRTSDFRAPIRVHGFHSEGGRGAGEEGRFACGNAERSSSPISHSHISAQAPSHTGKGSCFPGQRFCGNRP